MPLYNSIFYYVLHNYVLYYALHRGCPCCVMIKVLDYGIVVRKIEFQSRYYVYFWTNTLGKGMNPFIL